MARHYGVRTGVKDGRRLRKVIGTVFHEDRHGGHYWEKLSCGHEGKPIGDGGPASQRWCVECKWAGLPQDAGVEREVRLDEERVAAEMERASVRGISAPDY